MVPAGWCGGSAYSGSLFSIWYSRRSLLIAPDEAIVLTCTDKFSGAESFL